MTNVVLDTEVVRRSVERLLQQPIHYEFAWYLYLQRQAALEDRSEELSFPMAGFLDAFFHIDAHDKTKPYFVPFSDASHPTSQPCWFSGELAEAFQTSPIPSGSPLSQVAEHREGDEARWVLKDEHWKLARFELCHGQQIPVESLAAYMFRDYVFPVDEPSALTLVEVFVDEFGYELGGKAFSHLYRTSDTNISPGSFDDYEPGNLEVHNPLRSESPVRRLNPSDLGISKHLEIDIDEDQWEVLFQLANDAANQAETGAATLSLDGTISRAFDMDRGEVSEIHPIELAVRSGYAKYRAPIRKIAVVTKNSDFEPCGICSSAIKSYSADAVLRVYDTDQELLEEYTKVHELSVEAEYRGGLPGQQSHGKPKTTEEQNNRETPKPIAAEQDENVQIEYVRFDGTTATTYHLKYEGLHRTFCGFSLDDQPYRESSTKPDLLDPCKSCHGETERRTVAQEMGDLRSTLSDLVADVSLSTVNPGRFDSSELESLFEAIPTDFPEFERTPEEIRYHLSRAIPNVSDEDTNANEFAKTELAALVDAITYDVVIPFTPHVFIQTNESGIKRTPISEFRVQQRGGIGVRGSEFEAGEVSDAINVASPRHKMLLFTSFGQVYQLNAREAPELSRSECPERFRLIVDLDKNESVDAILMTPRLSAHSYVALVTRAGHFKRISASKFSKIRSTGITAIGLEEDDRLAEAVWTEGDDDILIGTHNGRTIRFEESDTRAMTRPARGVHAIKLDDDDAVVGMTSIQNKAETDILTVTREGYGKRTAVSEYALQNRYGRGLIDIRTGDRNGPVASINTFNPGDNLMILSKNGQLIHIHGDGISKMGRNTQGIKLIDLRGDDLAVSAEVIASGSTDSEN